MNAPRILLASFSHFVCDVNAGALPAILPYFVGTYGLSYSAVSGLMLANSSIGSVIQPFFGFLSDRNPKTWFMPLGILIAGLGMACLGFLELYGWLFCAVGVSGIGAALFHPAAMRFTNRYAGEQQGTATSIFSIGGNLGFLLAPLLAVFLIEHWGLGGVLLFGPLAVGTSIVVFWESRFLRAPIPQQKGKSTEANALPENNWRAFRRLVGALIGRSVVMVCIRVFLPLYCIHHFSQTTSQAALVLTLFGIAGIIGNVLGGVLADHFGFTKVITIAYGCMVPLLLVFPLLETAWLAIACMLGVSFFLYASFSPVVVVGQRYLAKNVGFAAGITLGLSVSIGGMLSPVLGLIADTYGLPFAFHTMTAIAFAAFISTLFLEPVAGRRVS